MNRPPNRRAVSAVLTALLVLSAPGGATAQDRFRYERAWALAGPCCGDSGHDIAVDTDGSFFIAGNYGALDLDGDGAIDQRSEGGHDAILMKGRPDGSLAWVRAPRSPAQSFARLTVAPDREGGVFLAGAFIDRLEFRTGERVTGRGPQEGLLARYDAKGDPLWARAIGGEGTDAIADAVSDSAGHVYVVGTVQRAVDLDGDGQADATVAGENGLLVASYDGGGTLRWAKVSAGKGGATGVAIAVDTGGAVHVAGHYTGADVDLDADGRPDLPASQGDPVPFLARFDTSGRLSRAAAMRGSGRSRISNLALADRGDLVVTGYTQGTLELDGDGRTDVESPDGRQVPYVARFDRDGTPAWVRAFTQRERVAILDLSTSPGRIAVSGLFVGRLDLDGDGRPDAAADPDGKSEGFVAILDEGGAIRQVMAITGPGHDQPRGVAFAPDGRSLAVTGFVRLTADFDGDGVPEGGVQCDNFGDIIFARYRLTP